MSRMLWCWIAALTAACGNDATSPSPDAAIEAPSYSPAKAKWEFWDAYHAARIGDVATARDHMIAAMNVDPGDDELPRLVAMSFILSINEGGTMPTQDQVQGAIQSQAMYLDQARQVAVDPYAKALDTVLYSGYPSWSSTPRGCCRPIALLEWRATSTNVRAVEWCSPGSPAASRRSSDRPPRRLRCRAICCVSISRAMRLSARPRCRDSGRRSRLSRSCSSS